MRFPTRMMLALGIGFTSLAGPTQSAMAQVAPEPVPAARSQAAPANLTGTAAWAALLGNTVSGTTPDGPYDEFYRTDGTVVHVDRDGRDVGRWSLKGPLVCFSFPSDLDDTECRRAEVSGSRGAFVDSNGTRYPFDMLPGDAKHL